MKNYTALKWGIEFSEIRYIYHMASSYLGYGTEDRQFFLKITYPKS
ncbi:MAG TPA: hypothetical protein VGD31_00740 [Sphingobacteriaceae bacterium]